MGVYCSRGPADPGGARAGQRDPHLPSPRPPRSSSQRRPPGARPSSTPSRQPTTRRSMPSVPRATSPTHGRPPLQASDSHRQPDTHTQHARHVAGPASRDPAPAANGRRRPAFPTMPRGGTHAGSHYNQCSTSHATTRQLSDAIPGSANHYPGWRQPTNNERRTSDHQHNQQRATA